MCAGVMQRAERVESVAPAQLGPARREVVGWTPSHPTPWRDLGPVQGTGGSRAALAEVRAPPDARCTDPGPQARSRPRYLRRRMLDVRIRVPQVRPLLRSMWERALDPKRDQVFSLITAGIGGLIVIGFLAATDVEFRPPSVLAGAFTAEVGETVFPTSRSIRTPWDRARPTQRRPAGVVGAVRAAPRRSC